MADGKGWLTEEQSTLLATPYGRAVEAAAARPILGDPYAAGVVRGIDFGFKKTRITLGTAGTVALRATHLDDWTQVFLAAHPEAIVLQLGCGLDSRPYRIDPPEGVRWFDVDYPEVIELRRRLYPPRDRYHVIGASVTDPGWLADVPAHAPALVVAEGLMLYLTEEQGRQLLERLTGHFPTGEIVFDAVSKLGIRLQRFNAPLQATGASVHRGIDDPAELERWNPASPASPRSTSSRCRAATASPRPTARSTASSPASRPCAARPAACGTGGSRGGGARPREVVRPHYRMRSSGRTTSARARSRGARGWGWADGGRRRGGRGTARRASPARPRGHR